MDFYIGGKRGIQKYSAESPTMPVSQMTELYCITPEFFKLLGEKKRKKKSSATLATFLDINLKSGLNFRKTQAAVRNTEVKTHICFLKMNLRHRTQVSLSCKRYLKHAESYMWCKVHFLFVRTVLQSVCIWACREKAGKNLLKQNEETVRHQTAL